MIYQIKIVLENSTPPIWRRIELSNETKLSDFHKIIQSTMGWMNGHLHQFMFNGEYYSPPNEFEEYGINYKGMRLKEFLKEKGDTIRYEYDFGDSLIHAIKLEKIKVKEEGVQYPNCVKGKRACPPEDCGGVWGYMELESIMKDPKHDQHEEMLDWLGRELAPEEFELDRINTKLSKKDYGVFSYGF